MSKKKREEESGSMGDPDAWMDTLSDLVFLMITFFVLLISMSSMDSKSLKQAFGFFDDATSVLKFPQESSGAPSFMATVNPLADFLASKNLDLVQAPMPVKRQASAELFQELAEGIIEQVDDEELFRTLAPVVMDVGSDVKIVRIKDGIEIVISGNLLFPKGDTELDEQALALLRDIAVVLQLWGGEIEVVATWSWYEGPSVLADVVEVLQSKMIPGEMIFPELFPGSDRKIRFILRNRSE